MIEKKQALIVGVFGGITFYILPLFIGALESAATLFKIIGGVVMAAGVIYFIAGDVFTGNSSSGYSKSIKKRLKNGEITEIDAINLQKEELESKIILETKKVELAKKQAEIANLKNSTKKNIDYGAILGGGSSNGEKKSMFPDILGNISGVAGTTNQNPMKNISEMMSSPKRDITNPRDVIGKKKKDNYDDLRDLF